MKRFLVGFILIFLSLCAEHSDARDPEPTLSDRVADALIIFIDQYQNRRICGTPGNDQLCEFRNVISLGNRGIFLNAHSNNIEFRINPSVSSGLYTSASKRNPSSTVNLLEIQQESSLEGANKTIWHEFIHHLVELQGSDAYLIKLASGGNGVCNGSKCSGAADACGLDEAYTALLEARHSWLDSELRQFERFDYNQANLNILNPNSVDAWISLKENWEVIVDTGGPGRQNPRIRRSPYNNYKGLGDGEGSLAGPFTWKDNACSCCSLIWFNKLGAGKGRPYQLSKTMIQTLDQAFGIEVDIDKIRAIYADRLDRDKVWQKEIDNNLTIGKKNICSDLAMVQNQLNPIVALGNARLVELSRPNAGTEANNILTEAQKVEQGYQKALTFLSDAETANKNAASAASAAGVSFAKIEDANIKAAAILSNLRGELPTTTGAQSLCADIITLVNQMNEHIENTVKSEADIAPFYEGTEQAKKKVCGEIMAISQALPDGANETMVTEATNIANRANQNAQNARESAQKSREQSDLAMLAFNQLKIKIDRKDAILRTISEFRQKLTGLTLIEEANLEIANAESQVSTAGTAAQDAEVAKNNLDSGFYVKTCQSSSRAVSLVTKVSIEAASAATEKAVAEAALGSAKNSLTSLTEKLNQIKNLETLANEVDSILNACAVPEISPIEGAKAAADRAEVLRSQAHDNWTEAEKCASQIREPRVAEEEEVDGEASEDVPGVLSEGEVAEDEENGEPSDEMSAESEEDFQDEEASEEISDGATEEGVDTLASPEVTEDTDEEESPEAQEPGVLDEWTGPWMGTLKAGLIKVNGANKSSSTILSELEQNYLQKKKRREEEQERERQRERAEAEAEGPSIGSALEGVQDIPSAAVDAMLEAIAEMIDIILMAIIDVSSNGIPIGFGLEKVETGYRIFVPGMPSKDAEKLKSIPVLVKQENGTYHGKFVDPNGISVIDIELSLNEDEPDIQATVVLLVRNIKREMPDAKYNSIEMVLRGDFKQEDFTYQVLVERLKSKLESVINKYKQRLIPETED